MWMPQPPRMFSRKCSPACTTTSESVRDFSTRNRATYQLSSSKRHKFVDKGTSRGHGWRGWCNSPMNQVIPPLQKQRRHTSQVTWTEHFADDPRIIESNHWLSSTSLVRTACCNGNFIFQLPRCHFKISQHFQMTERWCIPWWHSIVRCMKLSQWVRYLWQTPTKLLRDMILVRPACVERSWYHVSFLSKFTPWLPSFGQSA